MAINYSKVNWTTASFVNPNNMNQMDEGIKQACDKADSLENSKADKGNYSQKYAWATSDVNNRAECQEGKTFFLGWRATASGVDTQLDIQSYFDDMDVPSGFNANNTRIMYATQQCSASWGHVCQSEKSMYIQDGVFAMSCIGMTYPYQTVKALLMRTDI